MKGAEIQDLLPTGELPDSVEGRLELLCRIRDRLCRRVVGLSSDFPIVEVDDSKATYMGMCNCDYDAFVKVDDDRVKKAPVKRVCWVQVRLRFNEAFLEMKVVVPTLLHELAHCITPHIVVDGVNEDHGVEFYSNFKRILEVAEDELIYCLPPQRDKYSVRSLQRFDALHSSSPVMPNAKMPWLKSASQMLTSGNIVATVMCNGEKKSVPSKREEGLEGLLQAALKKFRKTKKNNSGLCLRIQSTGEVMTSLEDVEDYQQQTLVLGK